MPPSLAARVRYLISSEMLHAETAPEGHKSSVMHYKRCCIQKQPQRGMIVVTSRFNGWLYMKLTNKRAFRYAI